jgi:hypothetical protein
MNGGLIFFIRMSRQFFPRADHDAGMALHPEHSSSVWREASASPGGAGIS